MSLPPLVEPVGDLSPEQFERYSRHILLPEVGVIGQRRLKAARVLVIGAGGLGSPVLTYLAAAGVGSICIVDGDCVELSNLQRQVVHRQADIGKRKTFSAAAAIARINPHVDIEQVSGWVSEHSALRLLRGYDVVIDGTDNFASRYLISDACAILGIPCVWGSVYRFDGQVSVFWSAPPAGTDPVTYRDLHPAPPPPGAVPSCAEGGVLGVVCAAIGAAMANEVVKLICGIGEPLLGRLMIFDALAGSWQTVKVRRDPAVSPVTELAEDYAAFCGLPLVPRPAEAVPVAVLAQWLGERERGERDFVLVDVREPFEREIAVIPGAVSVPLAELQADVAGALKAVDAAERPIVLHCKSGGRSAQALAAVQAAGVSGAVHVEGGVLAWIAEIDPSQPRY